uniref:TPM domain-containing protein n=1 Tax=Agathobacter sp. TaxID=2021311 RepID=UPI0040576B12
MHNADTLFEHSALNGRVGKFLFWIKSHKAEYLLFFLFSIILLAFSPICASASEAHTLTPVYTNPDNGYGAYIDDRADLLTSSEEKALLANMEAIAKYGNVAFVSISKNPAYDTNAYAKDYSSTHFGQESSTLFLIDMQERYIWIYSNGAIYDVVTTAYANTITDNSYTYASDGDYFSCADTAFSQIRSLLEGQKIAQPMKYISNLLLAVILAMLLNYFFVMSASKAKKARNSQLLDNIHTNVAVKNPSVKFMHQTRHYSPRSSSSGGGGGSRGGGSRGGGGGHRF